MQKYVMIVHGGAGSINRDMDTDRYNDCIKGLEDSLKSGLEVLKNGGSALDAVTEAVICMENNPNYNAGRGASYNHTGGHELDASIMDGKNLGCGAVGALRHIKNPIKLARCVMEENQYVFIHGDEAEKFAKIKELDFVDQKYFDTEYRYNQLVKAKEQQIVARDHDIDIENKRGTVGAVALDIHGNIAAATSTGGMTNKQFGRIGDSPIIGAGTYAANETCAVSCTGWGEEFIRRAIAYDIHARIKYGKVTLEEAADEVINNYLEKDIGGFIALDADGNYVLSYNTIGMYRAFADSDGNYEIKIWE